MLVQVTVKPLVVGAVPATGSSVPARPWKLIATSCAGLVSPAAAAEALYGAALRLGAADGELGAADGELGAAEGAPGSV
ncbi:hypothetical protein GCM10009738_45530 [Kitasatospora viridis]